ncbi:sugar isomerase (SIS) family protein [Actinidia rufa]|uniref:Sugar isomerase (SIS) family protein n=1 Tax=Actinidia rufa TaxID=165716 RepID=A0A7J0EA24_9ERIC|nr:sugar isomerase (SIS) family protein [Actinidia rufa]
MQSNRHCFLQAHPKPTSPGPPGGRDLSGFNPQGPNLPLRSGPRGPHAQGPLHEAGPPRPLSAHSVFDMTTPPIASPDLLIASAGPGRFPTVDAICWVARSNGARVLLLTTQPGNGSPASVIAHVPGQTMADDQDGGGVGLGGSRALLRSSDGELVRRGFVCVV